MMYICTHRVRIWTLMAWALFAGLVWVRPAAGLTENLGPASIDWTTRTVTAVGESKTVSNGTQGDRAEALTERRAKMQARQKLWKGLLQVRVEDTFTVKKRVDNSPEKGKALRELVHTSPITRIESPNHLQEEVHFEQERKGAAFQASFSLSGQKAALCIPSQVWYKDKELAASAVNGTTKEPGKEFSGLIVDARGLGGKPALICRLVDEQGRLVYGPSLVSRRIGEQRGMTGYAASISKARADSRTGEDPLLVRARRRTQGSHTDFVVRAEDLVPLWASQSWEVFRQGKVILVLGEESGGEVVEYPLD
ncbi:MAG: hypothetical protein ACQEUB_09210 [Thermodesulfobacteriota bacterium]